MLNINRKTENGKADFALEGRLDTVTAPELETGAALRPEGHEQAGDHDRGPCERDHHGDLRSHRLFGHTYHRLIRAGSCAASRRRRLNTRERTCER